MKLALGSILWWHCKVVYSVRH